MASVRHGAGAEAALEGSMAESGCEETCEDPFATETNRRLQFALGFAVAFKQRHSEGLGGPTLGYRSHDAIGQSLTLERREGGLGNSVGLRGS